VTSSTRSAVVQGEGEISVPSPDQGVSRAEIITIGEAPQKVLVLVIEVTPTAEDAQILKVRLQLYPHRESNHLPRQIQIAVLSDTGAILSEAITGDEEMFTQLELLDCHPGEQFSVCLTLQGNSAIEEFIV
jgi:hypothetical protein